MLFRSVLADMDVLATLPTRQRWSGLAEIVKAGLIQDADYWRSVAGDLETIGEGAASAERMAAVVRRAIEIKADVVSRDEHERGVRVLLNFGHTFGHAIETAAGYEALTHGEAVTHGMRVALAISARRGRLTAAEAKQAREVLARFPIPAWPKLDPAAVKEAVLRDKKVSAGKLRFVVLDKLGAAGVDDSLTDADLDFGAEMAEIGRAHV